MTRITFVVSRDHQDMVPELSREARVENVEIIVDRRRDDRRRSSETHLVERRISQRRTASNNRDLELIGISVVVTP